MNRKLRSPLARAARLPRASAHFARGMYILRWRFAALSPAEQDNEIARWSGRLLSILGVELTCYNLPARFPERTLLVMNHVSWLDIFVGQAVTPGIFVAKSDIRGWPIVGPFVERSGTIFIERGRNHHARRTNERVAETLAQGRRVTVYPEGTTTDGRSLKRFHGALLQPAIDAEPFVQPIAIRYLDAQGQPTDRAAYIDDMTLVESMLNITGEPRLCAELHFAEPIPAAGTTRRELARACERVIAQALGLAPLHTVPETPGDPQGGPPSAPRPTRTPYPAPAD